MTTGSDKRLILILLRSILKQSLVAQSLTVFEVLCGQNEKRNISMRYPRYLSIYRKDRLSTLDKILGKTI